MGNSDYSYRKDPDVPDFPDEKPVILFDGHCVLCSRSARFIMKYDRQKRYRMLAAQTALGEALYAHYGMKSGDYDSVILIDEGQIYIKSDAGLRIMKGLGKPWSLATAFHLVPRRVRDWVYGLIARHRYQWFGQSLVCFVPPRDEHDRFIGVE